MNRWTVPIATFLGLAMQCDANATLVEVCHDETTCSVINDIGLNHCTTTTHCTLQEDGAGEGNGTLNTRQMRQ